MITEIFGDLFTVPNDYCLVQCLSADVVAGAGIAIQFNKKYNIKERLQEFKGRIKHPTIIKIDNVFNLITKELCWHKPTLKSLESTLIQMKTSCLELDIYKLAMPKIGCGIDKLNWADVKQLIEAIFDDRFDIRIYYIEDELSLKDAFFKVRGMYND
jgi:hypothetical protein